jgi:hypothetical protein
VRARKQAGFKRGLDLSLIPFITPQRFRFISLYERTMLKNRN